jgi:hypothetical protein
MVLHPSLKLQHLNIYKLLHHITYFHFTMFKLVLGPTCQRLIVIDVGEKERERGEGEDAIPLSTAACTKLRAGGGSYCW